MSFDAERLYKLLPAIYQIRDAELSSEQKDGPLKDLLAVLAEQISLIEENLAQLYDDQFIETCSEWVVPYIGDLIGYHTLHSNHTRYLSHRAEVANTIKYRRRKGTATMLEQLARDVTHWPARTVEFFQLLATTQYMNHIRSDNCCSADLRDAETLALINTPFDQTTRTIDVRKIITGRRSYNIPNIGIFLWRLHDYSRTWSAAVAVDKHRFFFSPLANNTPLFTNPIPEPDINHLAERMNVPEPIKRPIMEKHLGDYYGRHEDGSVKSILIQKEGVDIPVEKIVVCDLSEKDGGGDWITTTVPEDDRVVIDPELGRILFCQEVPANEAVGVTYHYGFSHDMGGGEYNRSRTVDSALEPKITVAAPGKIGDALDTLEGSSGAVEIEDSGSYFEIPSISVLREATVELRAAERKSPVLVLNDEMKIYGGVDGAVNVNGLLITGNKLVVPAQDNDLRVLRLQHCTLVPGLSLNHDGTAKESGKESLLIESSAVKVVIDHCIVGALRIAEGAEVTITNSIVDATKPDQIAYAAKDDSTAGPLPGGSLEIQNSLVIGEVHCRQLKHAINTIFLSTVASVRKQYGCVRFSFVPPGSRVPRRFRCQPDLAVQQAIAESEKEMGHLSFDEKSLLRDKLFMRIKPVFTSLQYGDPGYGQLALSCPEEIRAGADDESEMGAFHDLYQGQRETNLRVRLKEYLRFSLDAGILYAT